jgi:hypothetical protein
LEVAAWVYFFDDSVIFGILLSADPADSESLFFFGKAQQSGIFVGSDLSVSDR